jgi:hypothetical protein
MMLTNDLTLLVVIVVSVSISVYVTIKIIEWIDKKFE